MIFDIDNLLGGSKIVKVENLPEPRAARPIQWKAWIGLVALVVIIALDMSWPWGAMLLLWVIPSAITGSIHFVEEIRAKRAPFLFAAVTLTWTAGAIYLIAIDLL